MAAWLGPALKAVLPHVGTIISAVEPIFTRKKAEAAANQIQLMQQQIAELQSAASLNAEHIRELATQLQSTLLALEQAAAVAETRVKRAFQFAMAAMALALASIIATVLLLLAQ